MLKIQNIVNKNYYQEIDSIRAIAILLVVFFHYEVFNFTGGFLGVDVFFVLSGFLITKILAETEKKGYWLIFFFNKRLRRILPALYLIIIISTIFAFKVLIFNANALPIPDEAPVIQTVFPLNSIMR